jgi:hypothetical protein
VLYKATLNDGANSVPSKDVGIVCLRPPILSFKGLGTVRAAESDTSARLGSSKATAPPAFATGSNNEPHIALQPGIPGIRGLIVFRPETAGPLRQLAEILLRAPHSLNQGERELIATYVSSLSGCNYCRTVHGYADGSDPGD